MHWLNPVGRLKPGVSIAQAQAGHAGGARADRRPDPGVEEGLERDRSSRSTSCSSAIALRQSIYVALGAVVLVLLIACANITNLLLAQGAARQPGNGRARRARRQPRPDRRAAARRDAWCWARSAASPASALAALLIRVAVPLLPPMPFTAEVALNCACSGSPRVTALAVSVLVGLLPALRVVDRLGGRRAQRRGPRLVGHARPRPPGDRRRRSRRLGGADLRRVPAVQEPAAAAAGRRRRAHRARDHDVARPAVGSLSDWHHLAAFYPAAGRARAGDSRRRVGLGLRRRAARRHRRREPADARRRGAAAASASSAPTPATSPPSASRSLAGRGFTPDDRVGAPYVAVVNEALARRLARSIRRRRTRSGQAVDLPALGFGRDRRAAMTVVGVIGNERVRSDLRAPAEEVAYVPIAQAPRMQVKLAVRTRGDAGGGRARHPRGGARRSTAGWRWPTSARWSRSGQGASSGVKEPVWLIGAFAAVSALLAALGLYGVLAHAVAQRRREIGIRMALGARANDVLALVARSTLTMVGVGSGRRTGRRRGPDPRDPRACCSRCRPSSRRLRLRRRGDGRVRAGRGRGSGPARDPRRSGDGAAQRGVTATYGCRTLVVRRWCFHRGIDFSFSLEPVFHRFPVLSTAALVNLVGAPSDPAHSGFSRLERYPRSLGEVVATILARVPSGVGWGRTRTRCAWLSIRCCRHAASG